MNKEEKMSNLYCNSERARFVKDGKVKAIRDFVKFINGLNVPLSRHHRNGY